MLFEGGTDFGRRVFSWRGLKRRSPAWDTPPPIMMASGLSKKDGGGEGASQFFSDAVPNQKSDFITLEGRFGESLGGAVVEGEALAGFAV